MKVEKKGESSIGDRGTTAHILDRKDIEELEILLDNLVDRYQIDYKTLARIVWEKENDILIPAAVFRDRTKTITELAYSYLKYNYKLAPQAISRILNISNKEAVRLWNVSLPVAKNTEMPCIPAQIIGGMLSPFENIVEYLRERKRMKNAEIAHILQRSNKTVWTVYARAKEKKLARGSG